MWMLVITIGVVSTDCLMSTFITFIIAIASYYFFMFESFFIAVLLAS